MTTLTNGQIYRLVNEYIGVSGGYLGDFSYKTHSEFYPQYCDLDVSPNSFEGTTRERFIKILQTSSRANQIKILRGVLKRFPYDLLSDEDKRKRLPIFNEIQTWITQLEEQEVTINSLSKEFWVSFIAFTKELIRADFFAEAFPTSYNYYCGGCGVDDDSIKSFFKRKIGLDIWPFEEAKILETPIFEKSVELLYQVISAPTEKGECIVEGCGGAPLNFNKEIAQERFSSEMNETFKAFNMMYVLENGKIHLVHDEILSANVKNISLNVADKHLENLLDSAMDKFLKRDMRSKMDALKDIVDAFERVKSFWNSENLNASSTKAINDVTPIVSVREFLNEHMKSLTGISNKTNIRHHKMNADIIEDEQVIDFLFYSYYNIVKLLIQKSLNVPQSK